MADQNKGKFESSDELSGAALKAASVQTEDSKDLLDLCIDVIYHDHMKAFGLQQLISAYNVWLDEHKEDIEAPTPSAEA